MELIKEFVEYLASQGSIDSKATIKNYRADINQFIRWFHSEFNKTFNPQDITPQIINIYKKSRSISARSLERHLSSLNRFFKFLTRKNIIHKNPLDEMSISLKKKALQNKWRLSEFKNYLYVHRASPLTIKNYYVDIKQFFMFLEKTLAINKADSNTEKEVFSKITSVLISEYKYYLLTPSTFGGMGLLPTTVNRKLSSLRKYLFWAQKQNFINNDQLTISNEKIAQPPFASSFNQTPIPPQQSQGIETVIQKYSSFPPKRLLQKISKAITFLLDTAITIPLIKVAEKCKDILWELKGRPIFQKRPTIKQNVSEIHKISSYITYLPLYKRVFYYLRHTRPKWYKKYHSYTIVHYLHFAILVILMSAIGTAIYNDFWDKTKNGVLSENIAANIHSTRLLSLNGQLTDSLNNPIVSPNLSLRVSIYNDPAATGSALLWQDILSVTTDKDGAFDATLGEKTPLPQAIFFLHPSLWLGVSVGQDPELVPRQEIATTTYAANAQTLQGLLPLTSSHARTKNVLLALNSSGDLVIGESASPVFQATGGSLTLSGKVLLLSTVTGSSANVIINPDDFGKIDLQKPLQNTSNNNNIPTAIGALEVNDLFAVLATSSAQSAFTINQDSLGPIISASSSGTAKFTVENSGNIVSASGASWLPTFDAKNALNIASASGMPFVTFDTVGLNVGIGNAKPEKTLDVLGSFRTTGEIEFPALKLDGGILYATKSGVLSQIDLGKNTDCLFGGATPKFASCPFVGFTDLLATENNRLGIGTKNPLFKLDVQEGKDSTAAAQIFNTSTDKNADGLIIKLGNASISAVDNTNRFISFETSGIGIVGSVRGDGAKGIEFKTEGIADFAEYIKKDKNQIIEYGSVVCIDQKGLAVPCDKNNKKIVGVASNHGGFTAGIDLGENSIRVGFVGQVYTKVSSKNGDIIPGDPLKASDIPGVAVKAMTAGQIIGKALESFSENSENSETQNVSGPDSLIVRKSDSSSIPSRSESLRTGKILVSISVGWFDPNVYLASTGDIKLMSASQGEALRSYDISDGLMGQELPNLQSGTASPYILKNPLDETLKNIGVFADAIIANLKVGFLKAEEITTNSLTVATDSVTVAGKNLRDYVAEIAGNVAIEQFSNKTIVSPIAEIDQIRANVISPLASDALRIHLGGEWANTSEVKLIVENASGSAVATIDSSGNASFSGTLTSKNLYADKDATIGGTLTARKIFADTIEGLEVKVSTLAANYIQNTRKIQSTGPSATSDVASSDRSENQTELSDILISPIASDSPSFPNLPNTSLNVSFATITGGLMSFGPTSLAEASIAGPLYVQSSLVLASNSINVLSGNLEIQPVRQGGISFLSGLIEIDKDGNLKVEGNAEFAKNLKVGGILSTNILSPIPDSDLIIYLGGGRTDSSEVDVLASDSPDDAKLIVENSSGSAILSINQLGDLAASGSATFNKLNLNLVQKALAISNIEAIATGSAGVATIKPFQTELTVKNNIVTDKSLIYITPVGTPSGQMPFLMRQTPEEPKLEGIEGSFTVGTQSPNPKETFFNWLIVN